MGIVLSYSACERYLQSPMSYFLHYLLRLRPIELSSALFFGSAIDDALNELLKAPLDRSPQALIRAKDVFDKAWQTAEIDGETIVLSNPGSIKFSKADFDESLIPKDVQFSVDLSWLSLKIKGHLILEAYAEQIVPRIKEVLAVQKEISLDNEVGDRFTGIIDLIVRWEDDRIVLFDNKTSSIKYADDAINLSGQLATYFEAVKDDYKLDAVGYIVIPKKMRRQKMPVVPIEVMIGHINDPLIQKTFENYDNALSGIKNAQFECKPEGCCSKPWPCAYAKYCRSGGKDMTGLRYHKERKR